MSGKVIAIIGSSRFKDHHHGHEQRLTLQGHVVLGRGFFHHVDMRPITEGLRRELDALTLRKIAMADEVFVVSVNGYIGESTQAAIAYAQTMKRPIAYSGDESRGA